MLVGPSTNGAENGNRNSGSDNIGSSQTGSQKAPRVWKGCGLRDVDGSSVDSIEQYPPESDFATIGRKVGEASGLNSGYGNPGGATDIRGVAKAVKLLERRRLLAKYRAHPWPFLCDQVLTEDPHDKAGLIKPFPQLDYLKRLVDIWMVERRLLVPKSRRMLVSWTFIALHVWLLLFHDREYIYFAARKEGRDESEGSLELVKRAKFVINNLRDFAPPPTTQKRGRIICDTTHSEIVAVAQGEHQMRQLSATAIFADEFAFWEHARATYTAARPTIEGTGRFTGVSSAHPGFFKDLVFDEVA